MIMMMTKMMMVMLKWSLSRYRTNLVADLAKIWSSVLLHIRLGQEPEVLEGVIVGVLGVAVVEEDDDDDDDDDADDDDEHDDDDVNAGDGGGGGDSFCCR